MRLAWMTDLHFDFVTKDHRRRFLAHVDGLGAHAALIGGDTATAPILIETLDAIGEGLGMPVYFVLGNHDAYVGSIAWARKVAAGHTGRVSWLPARGVVALTETTALIGHDGWADGRYGDYGNSTLMLADYELIEEFHDLSKPERLTVLNALGDEAARYIEQVLAEALEEFEHVVFLTHVPPFAEACWHQGAPSDDEALPHFACKAVGDVLLSAMAKRPDRRLTVLCGHTHSQGQARVLPNLLVLTGEARYRKPEVQMVFDADDP